MPAVKTDVFDTVTDAAKNDLEVVFFIPIKGRGDGLSCCPNSDPQVVPHMIGDYAR